ncbi:hypothetical protein ACVIM8_000771 [Bradyrhizobium sp. USDA 4529]
MGRLHRRRRRGCESRAGPPSWGRHSDNADRQQYWPNFGGRRSARSDVCTGFRADIWPNGSPADWTSLDAWAGTSCWLKTGTRSSRFTASFLAGRRLTLKPGRPTCTNCFRRPARRSAECSPNFRAYRNPAGSITSMSTTSVRLPSALMLAGAGSSKVQSSCPTVAGSCDVPIPKGLYLRYREPGIRKALSDPPPRNSIGPPGGVMSLRRANWSFTRRSDRSETFRPRPQQNYIGV